MKNFDPKPPRHLSKEARQLWLELIAEYAIDDAAGLLLLQTGLEAFDRMREAQAQIKRDGATVKDRFDQIKAHPQITVERDARAAMLSAPYHLSV